MAWAKWAAAAVCLGVAPGAGAVPQKQSNAGDSISQGFSANNVPGDHPDLSWVQGTDASVDSVYQRNLALNPSLTQEPESVSGAELVSGGDSFAAQASRICAQATMPDEVFVLLGGNDVCNRTRSTSSDAAANLYSVDTWTNALRAGLDQLAGCLPPGAVVYVMSAPRVDFLHDAGYQRGLWCPYVVWPAVGICRVVTQEGDASRREQIGQRINAYNDATRSEVAAYSTNVNGKNPRGVVFLTDWRGSIESGYPNTSLGTYRFGGNDINVTDCFHPNAGTQAKLACDAWASGPEGSGDVSSCLQ